MFHGELPEGRTIRCSHHSALWVEDAKEIATEFNYICGSFQELGFERSLPLRKTKSPGLHNR